MTKATTGEAQPAGSGATDSTTRGLIALAVVVVTVLSLAVAGVLLYRTSHLTDAPLSLSNSGQPIPSDSDKHRAVAIAEQFSLRMDGVDGSDLEGYKKRVSGLLTTKQKAKFTSEFADFQKLATDKSIKGTGTILASGISDIDSDSATVLVAHDSSVKASTGTTQRHYRWTVALRKVQGRWLVDDFTPVS